MTNACGRDKDFRPTILIDASFVRDVWNHQRDLNVQGPDGIITGNVTN